MQHRDCLGYDVARYFVYLEPIVESIQQLSTNPFAWHGSHIVVGCFDNLSFSQSCIFGHGRRRNAPFRCNLPIDGTVYGRLTAMDHARLQSCQYRSSCGFLGMVPKLCTFHLRKRCWKNHEAVPSPSPQKVLQKLMAFAGFGWRDRCIQ